MDVFSDGIRWLTDPENWQGADGLLARTVDHLWLTAVATAIACVIALPVAIWLGHIGKGGTLAINISNVGRAVPIYAVLVILALTVLGRSVWTTIIALILFAIPPLLTNAYVGMREVDRDAVDAARGVGMSALQLVRKVELPLAIPLIMNGARLAVVQVFATATIAALVAGPGLGRTITAGFATRDFAQVFGGAVVVAILALLLEGIMELLQRRLDPVWRARRSSGREQTVTTVTEDVVGAR